MTRFLPLRGAVVVAGSAIALALVGPAGAATGPVLKTRPTVAGGATQGSRLVASPGSWAGTGSLKYSYEWYRCDTMGRHCRPLRGVHARSRRPGKSDVGFTLSVAVRASDRNGSTRAFASLVGPIAGTRPRIDSLTQPVILGAAVQGRTVRVDAGRWQPKPSALDYQWARCNLELRSCTAISGETKDTHDIGAKDLGHVLVAIVQARSGRTARAVFSTATAVAAAGGGAKGPAASTPPLVAEVLQQGNQLTGSVGSWSGSGSIAFTYSWYRCDLTGAHCKTIRAATKPTHLEGSKDVGHTLGFAVHATDGSGRTTTAYAPLLGPVAAVGATLFSVGAPTIGGLAAPGQTLQASSGSWSQAPTALGYQWQRCSATGRLCAPIAGATASSYSPTADDAGHRLLVVVHATAGTAAQDALSGSTAVVAAAAPVAAGPANTVPPTVTGTLEQGSQLTGNVGTWSGSGTIAYSYNWFRCDAAGAHCLSIHGATKPTYKESAKDAGHTLGFAVHATVSGTTTTAYAALAGTVAGTNAALASTAQPGISGTASPGQALQASSGSWSQTPTALGYQWQRCNANGRLCTPVAGATSSVYNPTAADSGHTLLVVVTGTFNGAQLAALSTHTGVVP